ncbi:L,D-transpeptidase family protein [Jiulongibacter sp. NS-SX5]|uniref:L,D-transpeptidase family protein n=1 Tax=Jiulongibacter sp. NS-SX5 TaxID=3463854 RepID=UPI0040588C74
MLKLIGILTLLGLTLNTYAQPTDALVQKAFEAKYGHTPKHLNYNGLKAKIDSGMIYHWLATTTKPEEHLDYLNPHDLPYIQSLKYRFHQNYDRLNEFQNFFRWKERFNIDEYVLINIANGQLSFHRKDIQPLRMKVIVGTRRHQTPTLATYADAVTIYPYWTATRNISINEILPKVKEDPEYLTRNNFDVLDQQFKVLKADTIQWQNITAKNFKFYFRQGTGCDNALGLLKINIRNPYSVYMHDTPHTQASKSLFAREARFYSHGCIRLEQPLELANALQPQKEIDQQLMNYCLQNQKPQIIPLKKDIPVFIMYFTDCIDENGDWKTVEDFYQLSK